MRVYADVCVGGGRGARGGGINMSTAAKYHSE